MSNATQFTGDRGDGWSGRDGGDVGYSRTLGGDLRSLLSIKAPDSQSAGGRYSDPLYLCVVGCRLVAAGVRGGSFNPLVAGSSPARPTNNSWG
jgi:hypothetical protein